MIEKKHYHLIGIGGAGMSAIAHILHARGEVVTGSDRSESDTTRRLRAAGIGVAIGHSEHNVNGADIVVYSAAIQQDNPEIVIARSREIPVLERPEMLGRMLEPYKHRVAISGTHGKTTTTSMVSVILDKADMDSTALIGGDVKLLGGNARLGHGSVIVTEACEAFASFLHLWPSIAVITNIEADHLDYYGSMERITAAFRQFVSQVDSDGCVIALADDPVVRDVLDGCGRRVVTFGVSGTTDFTAVDIDVTAPEAAYTLVRNGEKICDVKLGVPGVHNILNSLAAAAVSFELGVGVDAICAGLSEFRGAGRRFEILYDDGDVTIIDDYAHHPAEIRATLAAAKSAYGKRVIAVFQPHLYSRTQLFTDDFADALSAADEVIVTSIYAAREKPIEGVTAENITDCLRNRGFANVRYVPEKEVLPAELIERVGKGDLVLVLGAGDIRTVAEDMASILSERT